MINRNTYIGILRWAFIIGAVIAWLISIQFSSDGFNIEVPTRAYVGIFLSLLITVLELVFTKIRTNITLWIAGMAAYAYGMWSNVAGIMAAQDIHFTWANWTALLFPLVIAFFVEVVPEPLFAFALTGDEFEDTINTFLSSLGASGSGGGQSNRGGNHSNFQAPKGGGFSAPKGFQPPKGFQAPVSAKTEQDDGFGF